MIYIKLKDFIKYLKDDSVYFVSSYNIGTNILEHYQNNNIPEGFMDLKISYISNLDNYLNVQIEDNNYGVEVDENNN